MRQDEITQELRRRAERFLTQRRLVVDYYRIRRKISFPWPTNRLPEANFAVAGFESYIWNVWYAWEVEERINALWWWGEISGDEGVRATVRAEVLSVARWPRHFGDKAANVPGLWMSHLLRTLLNAKRNWRWLGEDVSREVVAACRRGLEQKREWMAGDVKKYQSPEQITQAGLYESTQITKNIPLISALMMHAAAMEAGDSESLAKLQPHVHAMLKVHLDIASQGMTEAIAYDGYVLDFMCDWLATPGLPGELTELKNHPAVADRLAMPKDLAAPGDVLNVANLSDVEPKEMTFYVSGIAKMAKLTALTADVAWHLSHCRLDWLRAEALGVMHSVPEKPTETPPAGARRGLYTLSLRSGWESEDVAVVMSASVSLHHHMHFDAGSVMIGHRGVWLLADPGYQQYLARKEREFTMGERAHNCPRINGIAQSQKGAKPLTAEMVGENSWRMSVDMTACYTAAAKVRRAVRNAWLIGRNTVAVCDVIDGDLERLNYHWHGLPEAAWWAEDGHALIHHEGAELWISCGALKLERPMIDRLPGSRGHLTLSAEVKASGNRTACWWFFSLGEPARWQTSGDGMRIDGLNLKSE